MLFEFLGVIGEIPGSQLANPELFEGKLTQLSQILLGLRPRTGRQIVEETQYLGRFIRHLGGQRVVGIGGKPQQLRQLMTQRDNFVHQGRVVPLASIRPLIGGASSKRGIDLFAQRPVVAVHDDGQIRGDIQREEPAVQLTTGGQLLGGRLRRFRQTGQFSLIGHVPLPAQGGIHHLIAEIGGQLGEASHNLAIALLLLLRQTNTGEAEVAQCVLDLLTLWLAQARILIAGSQLLKCLIEPFVLPDKGLILGEQRQATIMGLAQLV